MTRLKVLEITFDDNTTADQVFDANEAIAEALASMGLTFAIESRTEEVDDESD